MNDQKTDQDWQYLLNYSVWVVQKALAAGRILYWRDPHGYSRRVIGLYHNVGKRCTAKIYTQGNNGPKGDRFSWDLPYSETIKLGARCDG